MNKKIIIVASVIILTIIIYQFFLKKEEIDYEVLRVERGNVVQTISETGQVQKGEAINLSFKNSGEIERIYVKVDQEVSKGATLAKLDIGQLSIQLSESRSVLSSAQSEFQKLLSGVSQEEINKYQTAVSNKEITLETENQDLKDAAEDAINSLEDAYLGSYNAKISVDDTQRTYFTKNDQESITVASEQQKIASAVFGIKSYLDKVNTESSQENIDSALSQSRNSLLVISESLRIIRGTFEESTYRNIVPAATKTSLDTHRSNINTSVTDITNAQQVISLAKLAVETAKGNLQAAKDDLALLIAPPRQEDIILYQNKVNQAQAQVDLLNRKIADSYLKSPVKGKIIEIKKEPGELAQATGQDIVIVMLSDAPFEIKVDVYEEDITKVEQEDEVEIILVAFLDKVFSGKVILINPAEKVVDGVVYYEVVIAFEETPENLRPGMTADLVIKTDSRENVLIIPEEAIQKKEEKNIVQVFKDGQTEEREIQIGLVGSDDMVEVISGLEEGEQIIVE